MESEGTSAEQEELPEISKRLYEEYDVEIFSNDRGSSGTLSVLERGERAFIEWTPFDAYDVNNHMSFDEWGVIAHDASKPRSLDTPSFRIAVSTIGSLKQEIGDRGRPCLVITAEQHKLPPIFFPKLDSVYRFIQCLKRYLCFMRHQNTFLVDHSKAGLMSAMKELDIEQTGPNKHVYRKIAYDIQDVYDVTLSGLSKVTNFLRGAGRPASRPMPAPEQQPQQQEGGSTTAPDHLSHRPAESDFELYDLRKPLPRTTPVDRDWSFTAELWETHLDRDGRVHRVKELQDRIFSGGCDPSIRAEVWPFLLGVYPWDSTRLERAAILEDRAAQYEVMATQWRSITPDQMKRNALHRDREALVEKDVLRTDRVSDFYNGEDNPNVAEMYEMLLTYCQFNFDLGYVQGMSDLISPLHCLFKDKQLAFWSFVGYMEKMELHFTMDQKRIQEKLSELSSLVYYCDSELYNHLEREDSSNFFFCFRWLLINFKREFKPTDVLELWEVLWTCPYDTDYSLFVATAMLLHERDTIIERKMNFSDILRYINDLSCTLDLHVVLGNAEALFHLIRSQEDLPFNIRSNILHLTEPSPYTSLENQSK